MDEYSRVRNVLDLFPAFCKMIVTHFCRLTHYYSRLLKNTRFSSTCFAHTSFSIVYPIQYLILILFSLCPACIKKRITYVGRQKKTQIHKG